MSYSIETISQLLCAKRIGDKESRIDWPLTDSRSLCFAEKLFFLLYKANVTMDINISPTCMPGV